MPTLLRIISATLIGLIALNCHGQGAAASDQAQQEAARVAARAEQERILAQAAAATEKIDKAADALIAEIQAAVMSNAPVKAFDVFFQKLSTITGGAGRNPYGQNAKIEYIRGFLTSWQDYLYAMSQGNFDPANQALSTLIQGATVLPIVPRSELLIRRDQWAAKVAEADKAAVAPLLKRLEETFDGANSSADFDPFIAEAGAALNHEGQLHPNRQGGAGRAIQEIRQFATHWQEYLSLSETGKTQEAQNALRSLTSDNNGYGSGEIATLYRAKIRKKLAEGFASKRSAATAGTPATLQPLNGQH